MDATILLVEDDAAAAALVRAAVDDDGCVFTHASSLEEGRRYFERLRPSLVILDVRLPDGSGLELCREIRSHSVLASTPIIMLTGESRIEDKAHGFGAGADHYLVKPIPMEELRMWVKALLRRMNFADAEGGIVRVGEFSIDPSSHTVTAGSQAIKNLTKKEFELLYELMRLSPKVLSKERIMNSLWNTVLRDNTIEVHIRNLRSKLGDYAKRILTIPNVGYRFE